MRGLFFIRYLVKAFGLSIETAAGGLGIYFFLDIVPNKTIIIITNNCLFILEKEDL